MARRIAQACQAWRLWTGKCPASSPRLSMRTRSQIRPASTTSATIVANGIRANTAGTAAPTASRRRGARGASRRLPRCTASNGSSGDRGRDRRVGESPGRTVRRTVDHGPRADPTRRAGAPDQNSPAGTGPNTAEPGATSARLPTEAPGHSMLRAPTLALLPTSMAPICSTSPSSQWPVRSTSGSIEQPLPSVSIPRDRRDAVQVDVLADLGAQGTGVVGHPGGTRQVRRAQLVGQPLGQPESQVDLATSRDSRPASTPASRSRAPAAVRVIRPTGRHQQDPSGHHPPPRHRR